MFGFILGTIGKGVLENAFENSMKDIEARNSTLRGSHSSVRLVVNMYAFTHWRPAHPRSPISCPARLFSAVLLLGQAICLTGCGGAPSVTIAGAYFPAWLLCAVIGVLVAAFIRAIMVATGLANHIPYQLLVCCSIGAIFALILWHLWVVR